jgi:hypothetical protein
VFDAYANKFMYSADMAKFTDRFPPTRVGLKALFNWVYKHFSRELKKKIRIVTAQNAKGKGFSQVAAPVEWGCNGLGFHTKAYRGSVKGY